MEPNINPQSVSPTTPQTPTQPPIPEKRNSPILLLLLIPALMGVASYFGYQNWQLRQQIVRNQPIPTPQTMPTTQSDPTETWKTYTNTKFNYSVKYPNTGVARINCENEENMLYLALGSQQDILAPQNCARDSRFNIEIVASNKPVKNTDNRYQSVSTEFQIAEIKAVKHTYTQKPNFEGPGESWFEEVYFEKNGIYYDAYNRNKELSITFDQILSTFKFREQTQDIISNWKTISVSTDPSFGLIDYQINIPVSWEQIAHSSNFQNTEKFQDNPANMIYQVVVNQEKNINTQTGKPYSSLRELTGLNYEVTAITVAGQQAAKVLPRAGSETDFKVLFFSPDNKQTVSIELSTPRDGSKVDEGKQLFEQILATFKFAN